MKINGEKVPGSDKEWIEAVKDLVRQGILVQVGPWEFQLTSAGHALADKQEQEKKN